MFTYKSFFDTFENLVYYSDKDFHIYTLAVPGFSKDEIEVTFKDSKLFVTGKKELFGRPLSINETLKIHSDYSESDVVVQYLNGLLLFKFPKTIKQKNESKLKIL